MLDAGIIKCNINQEYWKFLVKRLLIQMEKKNKENKTFDINHCSVNLHEAIQTISQC
ncbi:hypothetical protein A3Q56_06770 [Intoshia linei]|uniref:Uncharacterized protein n=1 Tax=Intoshia linei TaxID=1819745 RepID=A0A177AUJ4_9BILA|nr:hypothetical protein A3Q56_06770 [Intoshia linei]